MVGVYDNDLGDDKMMDDLDKLADNNKEGSDEPRKDPVSNAIAPDLDRERQLFQLIERSYKTLLDFACNYLDRDDTPSEISDDDADVAPGEGNNDDVVDESRIFAIIGYVKPTSPADVGGLRELDELIQFDRVNATNFTDVHQLKTLVRLSINKPINIRVKRGGQVLNLTVVPTENRGRGFVGCQIVKRGGLLGSLY